MENTSRLHICLLDEAKNCLRTRRGRPKNHTKYDVTYKERLRDALQERKARQGVWHATGQPTWYLLATLENLVSAGSSPKLLWATEELSWPPVGEHSAFKPLPCFIAGELWLSLGGWSSPNTTRSPVLLTLCVQGLQKATTSTSSVLTEHCNRGIDFLGGVSVELAEVPSFIRNGDVCQGHSELAVGEVHQLEPAVLQCCGASTR